VHSQLIVESVIVSNDQFVDPTLTREDGSVLRDFIKAQRIQTHALLNSHQNDNHDNGRGPPPRVVHAVPCTCKDIGKDKIIEARIR
jgi:hypothetical protein